MKTTARWICEYLDKELSVDAIIDGLTHAGFGCEERVDQADGDVMLDFEVTSNRGDCVSVVGLARELAAVTGCSLIVPGGDSTDEGSRQPAFNVQNEEHELCPYYSARIIRGVKVGPSPDWLRTRLEAIGERSVNNVVDVTNFVLFELGQPLHAFDMAKIEGDAIIVRRGRNAETLTAIDGTKLKIDPSMLAICDPHRVIALAGVMGGLDTEVSEQTTDIVLEAASFNPSSVRTTSRKLRLHSPSSYRFERGVHPGTVADAADRAAQLIVQVCGGEIIGPPSVAAAPMEPRKTIALRPTRCCAVAGIEISPDRMIELLESIELAPALQIDSDGSSKIVCHVPFHRLDLEREADLIEEVVRLNGLGEIPTHTSINIEVVGLEETVSRRRRVDATLTAAGFFEVLTYSFLSEANAASVVPDGVELMRLQDDRRKAEPVLQASVLPGLLLCRKRNQDTGQKDVAFFERAACYGIVEGKKHEPRMLGLLRDAPDRQAGLRAVTGAVHAAMQAAVGSKCRVEIKAEDNRWSMPGSGGVIRVGDTEIGLVGIVNPALQSQFGLETPVAFAEINDDLLMGLESQESAAQAMSSFPSIQRDLSFVVDESVPWSTIESGLRDIPMESLDALEFVGTFRGKPIERGHKSVTLRLTFRADDRTLRHEEIDPIIDQLVAHMNKLVGAELRI